MYCLIIDSYRESTQYFPFPRVGEFELVKWYVPVGGRHVGPSPVTAGETGRVIESIPHNSRPDHCFKL